MDGCEGCQIINACYTRAAVERYNEIKSFKLINCPCRQCLVKISCDAYVYCENYVKWYNGYGGKNESM